jgi:predicted HD superfamily hydrolase involved in NAD metabolism
MDTTDYQSYLKIKTSPKRFEHSLGVMRTMEELAPIYGLDPGQAILSGLLHDAAKELEPDQWMNIVKHDERLLSDAREYDYDHYFHGPVGAIVVQRDLQVEDEEVLGAIATHGYYGPWAQFNRPLGWCLRMADILEPGRDWTNNYWLKDLVEPLRETTYDGQLREAALLISKRMIVWYEATGLSIHPNIRRVVSQYARTQVHE